MKLWPITVKAALARVREWHRDLPELQGGMFAVQVQHNGECVGVGIVGNPPRVWQGTGRAIISRCATPGFENACSMIYGALCRAAKALGYVEVWTYTLPRGSRLDAGRRMVASISCTSCGGSRRSKASLGAPARAVSAAD